MIFLTFRTVVSATFLFSLGLAMAAEPAIGEDLGESRHFVTKNRTISDLLNTSSVGDLNMAVKQDVGRARKLRACRIQRRQSLPPTLCYGLSDPSAELDVDCLKFSLSVERIPMLDDKTSENCRAALEKRRIDLAYARR